MFLKNLGKAWIFDPHYTEFASCHASNVCALQDGSVMAVWFAGTQEGHEDVAIWFSRRIHGSWCRPQILAKDSREAHWNPVLFQKPTGEILVYYKVGARIADWRTHVRSSGDGGATWSAPRELVPGDLGGRGPVRTKMLCLSDGSYLAGASTERERWVAYGDRSVDGGQTWTLSNPLTLEGSGQKGFIQPSLWESAPGHVHMLLRSTEGLLFRSDSQDFGKTWCEPYSTGLPNNNSGLDVVRCNNGMLVLCSNPVGQNWGPRTPLTLQVSLDNGSTWSQEAVLEDAPGEYSYPSLFCEDGVLGISYTYNRKTILYQEFRVL